MKIKIHQINMDLDRHRIKFDSYDSALKRAGRIDPSIYKTVFDDSGGRRVRTVRRTESVVDVNVRIFGKRLAEVFVPYK